MKTYKIKNLSEISDNIKKFENDMNETFKLKTFNYYKGIFSEVKKCYELDLDKYEDYTKCATEKYKPLIKYQTIYREIYTNDLNKLPTCVKKCELNNEKCLSKCFNNIAKKIYKNLKDFHDSSKFV